MAGMSDGFDFDVAFSLAGEQVSKVEPIAALLKGRGLSVFFYEWTEVHRGLPSVDLKAHLAALYGSRCRLVVPVLSADYQSKRWTRDENEVVHRVLIRKERGDAVFLLAADDTSVSGYLPDVDAAFSLSRHAPEALAEAIAGRVEQLKAREGSTRRSRGLSGVPPLPADHVVRTEELGLLQQALTAAAGSSAPLATVLVGMGGIGKTRLAQTICQPEHRPARYEDAAWIPVGQSPEDLPARVRQAARELGEDDRDYVGDAAVWARYRELLQTRPILVVLDDVWDAAHLRPFLVEGASGHLLVTTRNDRVYQNQRVQVVDVGDMTAAEALRVLRASAGRDDPADADIVERLRGHALALTVVGGQLRDDRRSSADWLASFTRLSQVRASRHRGTREDDLVACFDLSRDRLATDDRPRFDALGIFRGRVPDETVLALWAQLGLAPDDGGRRLLADLDRLSLIDRTDQGVALHDLLRDYACEKLEKPREAHRALLRAFGASSDARIPEAREHDPYYLRYSMYHFEHAGLRSRDIAFAQEDLWGWASVVFWFRPRLVSIARPPSLDPDPLPDDARIALMGNWATGRYGAQVIAGTLRAEGGFSLILHLGDVFRVGRPSEVQKHFLKLWPFHPGTVSRALNGNHDMLSGGKGYFNVLLPALKQPSSYFACASSHWLFIGLDTAFDDETLEAEQRDWLEATLARAEGRRVVLFSHHYLFSAVDRRLPRKLHRSVAPLLARYPVAAWYWSHDLQAVIYDPSPAHGGMRARSAGHGGVPVRRRRETARLPAEQVSDGVAWRRFPSSEVSPSGLLLDGPNPHVRFRPDRSTPHGYVTLTLAGPALTERYHQPDGSVIWDQPI
jgi:hypothetical protein